MGCLGSSLSRRKPARLKTDSGPVQTSPAVRGFPHAVGVRGRAVLAKHGSVFGPMPEPFSAARIPAFRRKTLSWANVAAYLPAPQCPPSALGDYPADKLHNDSRPIADCVGSFDAASNCAAGSQRLRNVIQRPGRLNGTVETPVRRKKAWRVYGDL